MHKENTASVPRSEKILGRADCLTTDIVGDIVRITGPKIGNRFQVAKIDISSLTDPPAVGIIVKKSVAGGTDCVVQFAGPMPGVYTALVTNSRYLVGTDGRLAREGDANFPVPVSGSVTHFQLMGVATSTDELLIEAKTIPVPTPTAVGQVLFSVDGATFIAATPVLSQVSGWIFNNAGELIVA